MLLNSLKTVSIVSLYALLLVSANPMVANPLQQWESWILEDHPSHHCPWELTGGKRKACIWPSQLSLSVNERGGDFSFSVEVFEQKTKVTLPGSKGYWPYDLSVNGAQAAIVDRAGIPHVVLAQGSHTVRGFFRWQNRPGQLSVPADLAIVSLSVDGNKQFVDRRNGQLIFSNKTKERAKKTNDSLRIEVFRLLRDGVPLKVTTQILLSVSGKAREVNVGRVMLEGTEVLAIRSPIPARIEADGSMRAQVGPGEHRIEVVARFLASPSAITTEKLSDEWPQFEYISFHPDTSVRQAKLSGPPSIDTSQISIPGNWTHYPTYRMAAEDTLIIETEFRGDHAPAANELNLQRDLWLDFNGRGITAFDRINGQMYQGWRLNTAQGVALGRASVDGESILITRDQGLEGIEIRSPNIQLEAVTRMETNSEFSASGWAAPVDQYSATLHLPPGWRVLHAEGVDRVWGTWLSKWDLWDVFLLFIILAVTRKLLGNGSAALSALTFLIALHEPGSPLMIVPIMLLIIALLPFVTGTMQVVLRKLGILLIASLVLMTIGFAVDRFRLAIYPSLERAQIGTYRLAPSYSRAEMDSLSVSPQVMESAPMSTKMNRAAVSGVTKERKQNLYQVSDNDRVQTGPGLPTWAWKSIRFNASGPVDTSQQLSVYYSKPLLTSLWLILSVFLVAFYSLLLIARFIKLSGFSFSGSSKGTSTGVTGNSVVSTLVIALAFMLLPSLSPPAMAENSHASTDSFPPKYLLDTLTARLTKSPNCLPACVSLSDGLIRIEGRNLSMLVKVYADANIALPLPNSYGSWQLTAVDAEGQALPLRRQEDKVYVALTKGHHLLTIKGTIVGDQASIGFALPIHNLSITTNDWVVEGFVDGRVLNDTLTLRAKDQRAAEQVDTLKADPVPTFARVIRHFEFAKKWTVHTTVIRENTEGAVSLPIQLLANERLLSQVGVVTADELIIQFEHGQNRIRWSSSLEPTEQLVLEAYAGSSYLEEWSFTPSSLWRLQYQGIPPLKPKVNANAFEPTFKPWPGETLTVNIRRPEGVAGSVYTVESALLKVEAGSKVQRATLSLNIRASIGADYRVTLPDNADVLKFSIDGRVMSTPADNTVIVPLQPRMQAVAIEFQTPDPMALISHSPQITLPGKASNIKVLYSLPRDRWPLYLKGPAIGPAMLYWGVLLVIVLVALGLPYVARAAQLSIPVTIIGWLLLGLGLSTVNSYGTLAIALMFFLLAARKQWVNPSELTRFQFNGMQVGIALWVIFAVLCMLLAIPLGLLSKPEMKVVGNLSSSHFYQYYQDMVTAAEGLPTVTVVSVPIIAYRVVMLLWSLWLSMRLIQWAIWAWGCYTEQGAWRAKEIREDNEHS